MINKNEVKAGVWQYLADVVKGMKVPEPHDEILPDRRIVQEAYDEIRDVLEAMAQSSAEAVGSDEPEQEPQISLCTSCGKIKDPRDMQIAPGTDLLICKDCVMAGNIRMSHGSDEKQE